MPSPPENRRPRATFNPDHRRRTHVPAPSDAEIDPTADMQLQGICTGIAYLDIAASVRVGGGAWSGAQNLTQTPNTDERFVSIAPRNQTGWAHVVFQASATNQAGVVQIGDRGTTPGNILRRIAYLEKPLLGSTVDAPVAPEFAPRRTLASWPNPARGEVRFLAPAPARDEVLDVFDLTGRRVARLALGTAETTWDGRDAEGRPRTGIYFARRSSDRRAMTKFLLLQ